MSDKALEAVESFMNANYPCECTDADCPGNGPEASEMVRMVRECDAADD